LDKQPSLRAVGRTEKVDRRVVFEGAGNSPASEDMAGEVSESEACTTLPTRVVVELGIRSSLLRSYNLVDLNIAVGYCPRSNGLLLLLDLDSHGRDHDLVRQILGHSSVDQSAQKGRRTVVV
jgi:hypothetical protein